MKTLISYLILFTLLLLQGCIQAPSNTRKSSLASSATATGNGKTPTSGASYPTFALDENLYWFNTAKITGTVTINKNSQDIIYLRGKYVHDFLNSKDQSGIEYYRKQYCMVGNFSASATYKQVRLRAIPIYVATSSKAIERLLRIDIPSSVDNASACNDTTTYSTLPASFAPSLPAICSTCTGLVTTQTLGLYEAKRVSSPLATSLAKIEYTKLDMASAFIRVDLQSNSTDSSSSCTNASCGAKGFDCCISGQCVKDASEKTNASQDPQYFQAKQDIASNPLSFINYPNIYYICSNIAHTPPVSSGPSTTPVSDAQKRVYAYSSDWKCLTDYESKGNNTFYVNQDDNTFLASLIGLSPEAKAKYSTVTCDSLYYAATKKKLAIKCGCTASDAEMEVKCPDWGIMPVYKTGALQTLANITDFTCYTPQPPSPIGPITNLDVSVPNRSAPHRFYSAENVNYDDISGLKSKPLTSNTVQEGDDFYYLDEYNKVGPVNGIFNVNSIIGKMSIDLNNALPAKQVTVELGKTYILSATSGYFTPCSQCAKDSWFQTFSAHPTSQRGVGLQASGHTTSRDTYSANTTFGNYEDTKFGRACYVPVTMLPLTHQKNLNTQTQRKNRLKTQAAFYVNGYQREWYGFNKGALIGSFDGITWFAIGTGRRATATSTKLYLALNASFLDLADKTDTIVNIIPDFSANTAADYDYDPDLTLLDSRQNTGATCQKYHQCSVDAECVSQLGWEYTCADVSQLKTKWPLFDSDANELANQERTGTLFDILQTTISTTNAKRCIYRGQGAPCKRNYATLNDSNKKALTCAPNFYCAALGSNKFNDELVRSPNELDEILFGMEANILGRPLHYANATKTLSSEIIANIKYNSTSAIGLSSTDSDDMGICRPGRLLTSADVSAHSTPDASKRADYISQIGSCNSAATGSNRFVTCPAFDDNLNYVDPNSLVLTLLTQKQTQNSCGAEAKHTTTAVSAFKNIEGLSLLNLQNIIMPVLAQDACFRRAGSICNSDLDCGPNKMHEEAVGSIDIKYFGGTTGEQSYWRESLVCGQGTPVPAQGTSGYFDYKLSDNRCCREIGKDFTMVTEGPKSIIPENAGSNESLITNRFTYTNPAAANRYSRYTISKVAIEKPTAIPKVSASAEPAANQWQVVNETGSLTCCGGGWIRKFADGTHDWKVKNRLSIDSNNFSCLNFRSPLADSTYANFTADYIHPTSYQREYDQFCKSPDIGGCMQIPFQDSNEFVILAPNAYDPAIKVAGDPNGLLVAPTSGYSRIDTTPNSDPVDGSSPWYQPLNTDAPYAPLPYYFSPTNYDVDTKTNKAYNFFTNKDFDYGVQMYLPAYVGWKDDGTTAAPTVPFINKVYIKYFYDSPGVPQLEDITAKLATPAECSAVINYNLGVYPINEIAGTTSKWCIVSDASKTANRPVMIVRAATTGVYSGWKYAGIIIDFKPVETEKGTLVAEPGNALYYLSKLARLELIGIPQITYEPLYCNNNQNALVPGIFKSSLKVRSDVVTPANGFVQNSLSYSTFDPIDDYNADNSASSAETVGHGNFEKRFTYQDKLDHAAVFSATDFACCTPLGKTTSSAAKCCSGYAATSSDGKTSTCKLPRGTDLNVYFNKFVSSEGVGDNQPGGGLAIKGTDDNIDFNAFTGEPKFRGVTYDKLEALGMSYCDGGTIESGGAFGTFPPEPFSGSYTVQAGTSGNLEESFPLSIVDSVLDFQTSDPNLGKVPFDSGYKWNHHYYCK